MTGYFEYALFFKKKCESTEIDRSITIDGVFDIFNRVANAIYPSLHNISLK